MIQEQHLGLRSHSIFNIYKGLLLCLEVCHICIISMGPHKDPMREELLLYPLYH